MDKTVLIYLLKLWVLIFAIIFSYLILRTFVNLVIFKNDTDRRQINNIIVVAGYLVILGFVMWALILHMNLILLSVILLTSYGLAVLLIFVLMKLILNFVFKYNQEIVGESGYLFFNNKRCRVKEASGKDLLLECFAEEQRVSFWKLIKYF